LNGAMQWMPELRAAQRVSEAPQEVGPGDAENSTLGEMVGRSPVMQRLFLRLRQSAMHLRILALEGEPGTGKTLTAKTLHSLGPVSGAAFVVCAAARFISSDVQPLLEEVRGGTLFLTRVNELTAPQQTRLFDFLEWWEHRNGHASSGLLPRQLFVSSHQPLRQLAANGTLRSDLSYRLTAIRFVLPPLREHREDIAVLTENFIARHAALHQKVVRGLGQGSLARLMSHAWPGNVRELEMTIANAVIECRGQWIRPIDIPPLLTTANASAREINAMFKPEEDLNLDRMILQHITHVLAKTGGNKLRAAQLLGISRSTLYRLLEADGTAKKS
jgi:DNA-binding NtrC family response regulator